MIARFTPIKLSALPGEVVSLAMAVISCRLGALLGGTEKMAAMLLAARFSRKERPSWSKPL
jgi:hypothetical protein